VTNTNVPRRPILWISISDVTRFGKRLARRCEQEVLDSLDEFGTSLIPFCLIGYTFYNNNRLLSSIAHRSKTTGAVWLKGNRSVGGLFLTPRTQSAQRNVGKSQLEPGRQGEKLSESQRSQRPLRLKWVPTERLR
jgi:hypothetical protein